MRARTKLLIAVFLLVLCGAGVAWHKVSRLGVPFWRGQAVAEWLVEARLAFATTGGPVKARLSLPALAVEESVIQEAGSLNYSYYIERESGEYTAVWSSQQRDGNEALYFRVRLAPGTTSGAEPLAAPPPPPQTPLSLPTAADAAARSLVERARSQSADPDSLFVAVLVALRQEPPSQEAVLVKRHYEREIRDAGGLTMAIDLLGMAGVPARVAYGVRLNHDQANQPPVPLLEYHDGVFWKVRDPLDPATVPDGAEVFVWHRGGGALFEVTGGEASRLSFTTTRDRIPLSRLTDLRDSPLLVSTILGLPAAERSVFRYIVLIPLGAFVVVLMRNLIGVQTLGTFMPVLLALALLELPLGRGLLAFGLLVAAGLWFRFLLSRLNLLVVPRVAACVVIVTLLMMLMSVISFRMNLESSLQITVFPMIILAWTIERMSLIWEEEGKRSAITQVAGSVVVAVCAYQFMRIDQLRYWAFYFPELLLVLLAGILLVGRYTGYRLSELLRFRSFGSS